MDDNHAEFLEAGSLAIDTVMMSDRTFSADPSNILIATSDPKKLRTQLVEWLAESPNRKVKADRKQAIAKLLDVSIRQVERLLNQYNDDRLREALGIERSDKGQHRIDPYWQDYIQKVYEKSLQNKHPMVPADVVREVERHAVIDLSQEVEDCPHPATNCPHPATIYRILKPLVERQQRRKKIRNPGS